VFVTDALGHYHHDLALEARAVNSPDEAKARGLKNLASMAASTGDADSSTTTDKFRASYSSLFTKEIITTEPVDDETISGDGNGKEILHLLCKLTEDADSPDLQQPLIMTRPTSFQQATSHQPGEDPSVVDNDSSAYQLVFAPGLITVSRAFQHLDPVQPVDKQVKFNVIAMELYKDFKGVAPTTDLHVVLQAHIANQVTTSCLESVYVANGRGAEASQGDTEWVRWDATSDNDAVATLIGTDNGLASSFILEDYKVTLGGKTLVAMYTRRQAGEWAMATQYS
jgi:hypothetical protein